MIGFLKSIITSINTLPAGTVTALLAIWTALVGLVTGLVTNAINNRANMKRMARQVELDRKAKREEMLNGKLEDIYVLALKWFEATRDHNATWSNHMSKGDCPQADEEKYFRQYKTDENYHRLEILVNLYHPTLRDTLQKMHDEFERGRSIIRQYVYRTSTAVNEGRAKLGYFTTARDRIQKAEAEFTSAVTAEAAKSRNT